MDEVPEVIQGALYALHNPLLCFQNVLKKLGYGDVKGPKAYRAAVLGEKKWKEISDTSVRVPAVALTCTVRFGT